MCDTSAETGRKLLSNDNLDVPTFNGQPATDGKGYGTYEFPTGLNYQPNTYDDITNFSNGTMESQIP